MILAGLLTFEEPPDTDNIDLMVVNLDNVSKVLYGASLAGFRTLEYICTLDRLQHE